MTDSLFDLEALPVVERNPGGFRILVTGSRHWTDRPAIARAITDACRGVSSHKITVVHGDARGADRIAKRMAMALELDEEGHAADWPTCTDRCPPGHRKTKNGIEYCPMAGHRRNAEMVALGADICLAFPLGESRGTRGCMKLAAKAGIPIVEIAVTTTNRKEI